MNERTYIAATNLTKACIADRIVREIQALGCEDREWLLVAIRAIERMVEVYRAEVEAGKEDDGEKAKAARKRLATAIGYDLDYIAELVEPDIRRFLGEPDDSLRRRIALPAHLRKRWCRECWTPLPVQRPGVPGMWCINGAEVHEDCYRKAGSPSKPGVNDHGKDDA